MAKRAKSLNAVKVKDLVGGQMYFLVDYILKATCTTPFTVCGVRRRQKNKRHECEWEILIKRADGLRFWIPDVYWFQWFKFTPSVYRDMRLKFEQRPM